MNTDKRQIRKDILSIRNQMSLNERQKASVILTERICGHQWFYLAENILVFVSHGSEIDTAEIIKEALKAGKKVYVPKVVGDDLIFCRIFSMNELKEGYKGILEPEMDSEVFEYRPEWADMTLMLMPGAVFDRNRNRIGYGKGFYDRYLADKEALQLRTIGIGFKCQLVDELPAEEWDIKPYQVFCV